MNKIEIKIILIKFNRKKNPKMMKFLKKLI